MNNNVYKFVQISCFEIMNFTFSNDLSNPIKFASWEIFLKTFHIVDIFLLVQFLMKSYLPWISRTNYEPIIYITFSEY